MHRGSARFLDIITVSEFTFKSAPVPPRGSALIWRIKRTLLELHSKAHQQISRWSDYAPSSLCPKEALGRVWRRKALPLEDYLNCFRAGRWWWWCCCVVSSLMIKTVSTGVWEVQVGIHLWATAERFHWDLKKNAMQAESLWIHHHTKRRHFLNGASCCVNAKWGDGSSSRQWRCFHMHDSAAFFHFSFHSSYSCLCLRLW